MANENVKEVEKETECECASLKQQLEDAIKTIEQLKNLNKQYEDAYKEISIKYDRLYSLLGNTIEYSLNIK